MTPGAILASPTDSPVTVVSVDACVSLLVRAHARHRQTQRRMIAALYWQSGSAFVNRDSARARAGREIYGSLSLSLMRYALEQHAHGMALWDAASAMEAAL